MKWLPGMGLFFLVVGCGPSVDPDLPEEREQEMAVPIIGGETDPGDPSVVALYGEGPGTQGGFLCTASVIAPTVVLTAAHCVSSSETGPGVRFVVMTRPKLGQKDNAQLEVREVHANPHWNKNNLEGGHDEGIVILAQPTKLAPLSINRVALGNAQVGQAVRIVGYGADDGPAQSGAGIKREAMTQLKAVSENLIRVGTSKRGTCNGDSGGPAFMEIAGTETIVGTTSFGNQICTDGGYSARVDRDLAFIDSYVAGGCMPACGTRSCGSDGCGGSCGSCSAGKSCTSAGQCAVSMGGCENGGREQEPNDSALQANALCPGGVIRGTSGSETDEDWFTFTVGAASSYEVSLAGGPTGASLRVYKSSADGRLSFIGDGPGVSRHTDVGGAYLARVIGGTASSATYTLTVRTSP